MKKSKGFTLIELLIVIVIIAILASVAILSLLNAQAKAENTGNIAGARQVLTATESHAMDSGGIYFSTNITAGSVTRAVGVANYNTLLTELRRDDSYLSADILPRRADFPLVYTIETNAQGQAILARVGARMQRMPDERRYWASTLPNGVAGYGTFGFAGLSSD